MYICTDNWNTLRSPSLRLDTRVGESQHVSYAIFPRVKLCDGIGIFDFRLCGLAYMSDNIPVQLLSVVKPHCAISWLFSQLVYWLPEPKSEMRSAAMLATTDTFTLNNRTSTVLLYSVLCAKGIILILTIDLSLIRGNKIDLTPGHRYQTYLRNTQVKDIYAFVEVQNFESHWFKTVAIAHF